MKCISVTGSRYYPFTKEEWDLVDSNTKLEAIDKGMKLVELNIQAMPLDWTIVSGGAKGPDSWAEKAANERGMDVVVYPAEWDKYGRGAGLRRNTLIASHADSCLVFWDGESKGTNDFIKKAYRMRKELFIVGPTGTPWAIFDEGYWDQYAEKKPPKMDIPKGK